MIICQTCGSGCIPQSDEMMNGRDDLYSCPVCKEAWQEVDEYSSPCQEEEEEE